MTLSNIRTDRAGAGERQATSSSVGGPEVRGLLKRTAQVVGLLWALPHVAGYRVLRAVIGDPDAFSGASERISLLPGRLGVYARQAFYRAALASCGDDVYFGFGSLFSKPQSCIGARVFIGRRCTIGWADIGAGAMLADGVQVLSGRRQHGRASVGTALRDNDQVYTKVTIGSGAWIGAGAIVMADVGAHAVVGAGSVVVKPVPAAARVAGVPAAPIRLAA